MLRGLKWGPRICSQVLEAVHQGHQTQSKPRKPHATVRPAFPSISQRLYVGASSVLSEQTEFLNQISPLYLLWQGGHTSITTEQTAQIGGYQEQSEK